MCTVVNMGVKHKDTLWIILRNTLIILMCTGVTSGFYNIKSRSPYRKGNDDDLESSVAEWPSGFAIGPGESRRIPFTFKADSTYRTARIEINAPRWQVNQPMILAVLSNGDAVLGYEQFFSLIPDSPFDLNMTYVEGIKDMGQSYIAMVSYRRDQWRPTETRRFDIAVYDEPECSFKHDSLTSYVSVGDNVTLTCLVDVAGSLVPTVDWFDCNGNKLSSTGSHFSRTHKKYRRHIYTYKASVIASADHATCAFTCRFTFEDDEKANGSQCKTAFRMESVAETEGVLISEWPRSAVYKADSDLKINFTFAPQASFTRAEIAFVIHDVPNDFELPVITVTPDDVTLTEKYVDYFELVPGDDYSIRMKQAKTYVAADYVARVTDTKGRSEAVYFTIDFYDGGPTCGNLYTGDLTDYAAGETAKLRCVQSHYGSDVLPTFTWYDCEGNILLGNISGRDYIKDDIPYKQAEKYTSEVVLTPNHGYCPFTCKTGFEYDDGRRREEAGSCSVQFEVLSSEPRCSISEFSQSGTGILYLNCFTKSRDKLAQTLRWYGVGVNGKLTNIPGEYLKQKTLSRHPVYKQTYSSVLMRGDEAHYSEAVCHSYSLDGQLKTCSLKLRSAKICNIGSHASLTCARASSIQIHRAIGYALKCEKEDCCNSNGEIECYADLPKNNMEEISKRCNGENTCMVQPVQLTCNDVPFTYTVIDYVCVDPKPELDENAETVW